MNLATLTIRGFRCYGNESITLRFGALTTFVGTNGSGKTAALMALWRMFGTTSASRTLSKEDFHLAHGDADPEELSLQIETRFELPELLDGQAAQESPAVPECLRHILAKPDGSVPIARIRLSAVWRKTPSAEGDIEQRLEWINTVEDEPAEDQIHPLHPWERSLIQVFYVPASRDAARELRFASGTILNRALARVEWSDETRAKVMELTRDLAAGLRREGGFVKFETHLQTHWGRLHGGNLGNPELSLAEADLANVLKRLDAQLVGGTSSLPIALLSEGERSLLYFALVVAALRFEAETVPAVEIAISSPVLTILAVEEPENHLAPYYLSRILKSLREVSCAQVALTSHSASILRRIRPEEVRHFRVAHDGKRVVNEIKLPLGDAEALKYVCEAVQAHPELYFASVVVLGEGASEEYVLPRMARALDVDVDPRFIAVVPLGGRHVQHMWRLLRTIGTPHVTLVDLDMERHEGGWKRLHNLATHLIDAGEAPEQVRGPLTEKDFTDLRERTPAALDAPTLAAYLAHLEDRFSVFLSAPLDLDMLCLVAFEATYCGLVKAPRGPRFPSEPTKRAKYVARAVEVVLGEEEEAEPNELAAADGAAAKHGEVGAAPGSTYADHELFPWYRHLFLSGSKPVAHARALASLEDAEVNAKCPAVLRRLVLRVKDLAERVHG